MSDANRREGDSPPVDFIFCIHNHQPVGNFSEVLEKSYQRAYLPFLMAMARRPWFKLSFHVSGFLLDWITREHPKFIEILKGLAGEGRAEIMGGGYYEPILSVIPERDRVGQICLLSDRIEELFGKRPRGMWLAERIWEPTLPGVLNEAGIEYVVLDDYHFIKAGLECEDLNGYYITEDSGSTLNVFAGSERLRYLIPFKPAKDSGEHIESAIGGSRGGAVVYADDGEKFGIWPRTHRWVYERGVYDKGWLEAFLDDLEARLGPIRPTTFSEFMDRSEPLGRVYLPTTSYMEMGGWTLPERAAHDFSRLESDIRAGVLPERVKRFVKGGFWRNFFSKYPESNWMHKRMLLASERINDSNSEEARRALYMSQCNDAYWHGVFGGLYMPHLRCAVYENIMRAEALADGGGAGGSAVVKRDVDACGHEEIVLDTGGLRLFISPMRGGAVEEIDLKEAGVNISNTLTRWREGYHEKLIEAAAKGEIAETPEGWENGEVSGDGGDYEEVASIHDLVLLKEEGLEKLLIFDSGKRSSFLERLFPRKPSLEGVLSGEYDDLLNGGSAKYGAKVSGGGVTLKREALLGGEVRVAIGKNFKTSGQNSFRVEYAAEASGGDELFLGVELNLLLPASDGPAASYGFDCKDGPSTAPLFESGECENLKMVSIVDSFSSVRVEIETDGFGTLFYYPIETVTQSEAGFERIFQGVCLILLAPLAPGKAFAGELLFKAARIEAP